MPCRPVYSHSSALRSNFAAPHVALASRGRPSASVPLAVCSFRLSLAPTDPPIETIPLETSELTAANAFDPQGRDKRTAEASQTLARRRSTRHGGATTATCERLPRPAQHSQSRLHPCQHPKSSTMTSFSLPLLVLLAAGSAAASTTQGQSKDGNRTLSCTEPGLCDLGTRE